MNVVDSSGWLEYFADTENAKHFAEVICDTSKLLVPTISLAEVFKRVLQQRDENTALQIVATMQQGHVIDLDSSLALSAAKLGQELKLPMADAIILATARRHGAVLWTQDSDFAGIGGVKYFPKTETSLPPAKK